MTDRDPEVGESRSLAAVDDLNRRYQAGEIDTNQYLQQVAPLLHAPRAPQRSTGLDHCRPRATWLNLTRLYPDLRSVLSTIGQPNPTIEGSGKRTRSIAISAAKSAVIIWDFQDCLPSSAQALFSLSKVWNCLPSHLRAWGWLALSQLLLLDGLAVRATTKTRVGVCVAQARLQGRTMRLKGRPLYLLTGGSRPRQLAGFVYLVSGVRWRMSKRKLEAVGHAPVTCC